MTVIPAIDIFENKAVRLFKGDYSQMTVYGDPCEKAVEFSRLGAEYIHLVDLEGAKKGSDANFETVKSIISSVSAKCEIGGGIRDMETLRRYASAGACRMILGTSAVSDLSFLKEAVKCFGERIAVGADVRNRLVSVRGWTETTDIDVFAFISEMKDIGIKTVICTDISRDGVLSGPNVALYRELVERAGLDIIASGGVSGEKDIRALAETGVSGAIVGKALYNGSIGIKEALAAAGEK